MKHVTLFVAILFTLSTTIGYAQSALIDSTQLLKIQERTGKISGQLVRDREKLAQLEKEYAEKTADKQRAIEQAENSATENRNAAVELSNDAQNRKKARQAARRASRARRDTKSAQRAEKNLERLERNINKVKKQIEAEEKSLAELQQPKQVVEGSK